MSKYLMNKFIHHVNMNESAEKEYKSNPRALKAGYPDFTT